MVAASEDGRVSPLKQLLGLISFRWKSAVEEISDLALSDQRVLSLGLPKTTSQHVLALSIPGSTRIVFVVGVEQLSERSLEDVRLLVRAVQPAAVVTGIPIAVYDEVLAVAKEGFQGKPIPTTIWGILYHTFLDFSSSSSEAAALEVYESRARNHFLKCIFGSSFFEYAFVACEEASKISSPAFLVEPQPCEADVDGSESDQAAASRATSEERNAYATPADSSARERTQGWLFKHYTKSGPNGLTPVPEAVLEPLIQHRLILQNSPDISLEALEASIPAESDAKEPPGGSLSSMAGNQGAVAAVVPYPSPPFASALLRQHLEFLAELLARSGGSLPVLAGAKKLLWQVGEGQDIDLHSLWCASFFRVAVEHIRWTFTTRARKPSSAPPLPPAPSTKKEWGDQRGSASDKALAVGETMLAEMSREDRDGLLVVQALRRVHEVVDEGEGERGGSQRPIVAVMESYMLARIRKQWTTQLAPELAGMHAKLWQAGGRPLESKDVEGCEDHVVKVLQNGKNGNIAVDALVLGCGATAAAYMLTLLAKLSPISGLAKSLLAASKSSIVAKALAAHAPRSLALTSFLKALSPPVTAPVVGGGGKAAAAAAAALASSASKVANTAGSASTAVVFGSSGSVAAVGVAKMVAGGVGTGVTKVGLVCAGTSAAGVGLGSAKAGLVGAGVGVAGTGVSAGAAKVALVGSGMATAGTGAAKVALVGSSGATLAGAGAGAGVGAGVAKVGFVGGGGSTMSAITVGSSAAKVGVGAGHAGATAAAVGKGGGSIGAVAATKLGAAGGVQGSAGGLQGSLAVGGGGKTSAGGYSAKVLSEMGRYATRSALSFAQVTAVRAVRLTLYSMMRSSSSSPAYGRKLGGSRAALYFGASVGAFALLWGDPGSIQRTVHILPHAPPLARLGRGIANLQAATDLITEQRQQRLETAHAMWSQAMIERQKSFSTSGQ